jgi:hypothetical protein
MRNPPRKSEIFPASLRSFPAERLVPGIAGGFRELYATVSLKGKSCKMDFSNALGKETPPLSANCSVNIEVI